MDLDGGSVRWVNWLVHAWEGGGLFPFLWHLAC